MQRFPELEPVLSLYPSDCRVEGVESLGSAGGFSGAQLWRLTTPSGPLCLRRWPAEHPDETRLRWIQSVAAHVHSQGYRLFPQSIAANSGCKFIRNGGHLWELTTWLAGNADYWTNSRPEKLEAAMIALAEFHRAAETFSSHAKTTLPHHVLGPPPTVSPGIADRLSLATRLLAGDLTNLRVAAIGNRRAVPVVADLACELLQRISPHLRQLQRELNDASHILSPLQPCLRDIWHDHVLFEGQRVSGIVDLGSMRMESIAADIARLLGSFCGNDRNGWSLGLASYQAVRPLAPGDRTLVAAFDRSQMLLAGVKWVEWVFVERRAFSDPDAVVQRMEHILRRLREACL